MRIHLLNSPGASSRGRRRAGVLTGAAVALAALVLTAAGAASPLARAAETPPARSAHADQPTQAGDAATSTARGPGGAGALGHPITWGAAQTVRERDGSWPRLLVGQGKGAKREDLLFYTTFVPGQPATITVTASTDHGKSGTVVSTIPSPKGTIQEQAYPLRLADGTILIATRYRTQDLTSYALPVFASHDQGRTWTRISSIDDNPDAKGQGNRGLWEPFLAALPNGCVAGMYASELHADPPAGGGPTYSQTLSERLSCDGGVTWGAEHYVAASPGDARPGMPGLARMADGRFIATFEACVRDDCNAHYKISRDGVRWFPGLGTQIPDQNAGPFVTALSDGRLAVTSACTNELSLSEDLGATWHTNATRPFDLTCADGDYPYTWPALYQVGPREVVDLVNTGPGTIQIRYGRW